MIKMKKASNRIFCLSLIFLLLMDYGNSSLGSMGSYFVSGAVSNFILNTAGETLGSAFYSAAYEQALYDSYSKVHISEDSCLYLKGNNCKKYYVTTGFVLNSDGSIRCTRESENKHLPVVNSFEVLCPSSYGLSNVDQRAFFKKVDFTTNEPDINVIPEGSIYLNTKTGTSSRTSRQVIEDHLYEAGINWQEKGDVDDYDGPVTLTNNLFSRTYDDGMMFINLNVDLCNSVKAGTSIGEYCFSASDGDCPPNPPTRFDYDLNFNDYYSPDNLYPPPPTYDKLEGAYPNGFTYEFVYQLSNTFEDNGASCLDEFLDEVGVPLYGMFYTNNVPELRSQYYTFDNFLDEFSGYSINYEEEDDGCRLNVYGKSKSFCQGGDFSSVPWVVKASYHFPKRDDTLELFFNDTCVDCDLESDIIKDSSDDKVGVFSPNSGDNGYFLELDCNKNSIDCSAGSPHTITLDVNGQKVDFCYETTCNSADGWVSSDDTRRVSCATICDDPDSCIDEDAHCLQGNQCNYNIKHDSSAFTFDSDEMVAGLSAGVDNNWCSYNFECTDDGFTSQSTTDDLLIYDVEDVNKIDLDISKCITGVIDAKGNCACPEGTHYDISLGDCVDPSTALAYDSGWWYILLYNYGGDYNPRLGKKTPEWISIQALGKGEPDDYSFDTFDFSPYIPDPHYYSIYQDKYVIPFFSCDESEYYALPDVLELEDMETSRDHFNQVVVNGECRSLNELSGYDPTGLRSMNNLDSNPKLDIKDFINGVFYAEEERCVSGAECVDCNGPSIIKGLEGYCDVNPNFEGWIAHSEKCIEPGTLSVEGNHQICYYSDSEDFCTSTGCNVKRSAPLIGEGWGCDPRTGPFIEEKGILSSTNTLSLMPSILGFGLQSAVKTNTTSFNDITNCSCDAQVEALETTCPTYQPLNSEPLCSCVSDKRLVTNRVWSDDFSTSMVMNRDQCNRLGFGSECYWNYDKTFNLGFSGDDLSEKDVWCETATNGDYCEFSANKEYKFDFQVASLIDSLVYAYDHEHQFPIDVTYFSRGDRLVSDDGSSEGLVVLGADDYLTKFFNIDISESALAGSGLDYASVNIFCSNSLSGENELLINDKSISELLVCDNTPSWKEVAFDIGLLREGQNSVTIKGSEIGDLMVGVDLSQDVNWLFNGSPVSINNVSPASSLIKGDFTQSFVNGDELFLVNNDGLLIDYSNNVEVGSFDEPIIDALRTINDDYFVLTTKGLYFGISGSFNLIKLGSYDKLFFVNDSYVLVNKSGFLTNDHFFNFPNKLVVEGVNGEILFSTNAGLFSWSDKGLSKLYSKSFDLIKACNVNIDGQSDLIVYDGVNLSLLTTGLNGFSKELLVNNFYFNNLAVTDLNFNGFPELLVDNISPLSSFVSDVSSFKDDNVLRIEFNRFNKSFNGLLINGYSWNASPNTLYTTVSDGLIKYYGSELITGGDSNGSPMIRLNYLEKSPVAVPNLLFPNINVDPRSLKVKPYGSSDDSYDSMGDLFNCSQAYTFNLTFIQDELADTSYKVFNFSVNLGGAPLFCDNGAVISFEDDNVTAHVETSCQMPNCHWGLPQYQDFRVCVDAGEFAYENCYSLDTIIGLRGPVDGLCINGCELMVGFDPDRLSVVDFGPVTSGLSAGNYDIGGVLFDSDDYYEMVSGFYLERNGIDFCVNASLIPVNGGEVLFYDDCLLTPGVYEAHVYAGNYWDKVIGSISISSQCSSDGDCDDNNPCTSDACSNGLCNNEPSGNEPSGSEYSGVYCAGGMPVDCLTNNNCGSFYEETGICYYNPTCMNNECEYGNSDLDNGNNCPDLCTSTGYNYDVCESGQSCEAGNCVVSCNNECSSNGAIRGYNEINSNFYSGYQICVNNYDSDPCLEWGSINSCPSTQSWTSGDGSSCAVHCGDGRCDNSEIKCEYKVPLGCVINGGSCSLVSGEAYTEDCKCDKSCVPVKR